MRVEFRTIPRFTLDHLSFGKSMRYAPWRLIILTQRRIIFVPYAKIWCFWTPRYFYCFTQGWTFYVFLNTGWV